MKKVTNPIRTARVQKAADENYRVKTLEMDCDLPQALPGQFLMVWVPGAGEKPMSIGNSNPLTISVAKVGKVSGELHALKAGGMVSFRGPFGKPFNIPERAKRILVIGGGYGVVPMYFLAKVARENGIAPLAVIGARTAKDIVWEKQLFTVCKEVFVTTDDGTRGKKGNVLAEAQWLIEGKKIDAVYACGPERMMEAVAQLCVAHKIPCEVSVERYMKCGVGVCGSCAIDGKLCCVDGPVFSAEEALSFAEFGKSRRDASGRKC
ncbi:dihydroorotate dehydrogenase electron transfer subunit [Candidatus Micrarchaeota archaeon]|nr:dihydroorotate dehydrogenase electron transfer subunit [Candidatus Micrarchaeota archaeon]